MFKTRFLNIVIGSMLVLIALAAYPVFKSWNGVNPGSQQYSGMGDLRRFEAAQIVPITGGHENFRTQIGMGDLHLSETRQLTNENRNVGMGDLHLLEWWIAPDYK